MLALLQIAGLTKRFGGLLALDRCALKVTPGSVVGLFGPNGSGKTTLLNLVTGVLLPEAGTVRFFGRNITGMPPFRIARLGIGRTFQSTRVFRELSVAENLAIGGMVRRPADPQRRARELLHQFRLQELAHAPAGSLGAGQQRLLELAMNLMADPALLLMDEPAAGMPPPVRQTLAEQIQALRRQGKAFLICEHDLPFVLSVCDQVVVLDHGEQVAEGPPAAIADDPALMAAYLGRRRHADGF